ncbi:uncharacterized protein Flad1 [Drosophila montana]|uniref:uncharacterized protein Flad1 n=1 Tax=Drosophila montana TaxID=40370 RepID=UPI00313D34B1
MNKCCIQTQQATIKKSSNIVDIYSSGNSTTNCNGSSNGSSRSMSNDDDYPVSITDATRAQIERRVRTAYDFFDQTLRLYDVTQLIFCFNGGKDCTVLLDLLMRYCREHGIASREIPMLYIESDDSFAEIDDFVVHCVRRYDVNLIKYKDSLKVALTHMTEDMPRIKAVFVGSRNTDPYCQHLQPMQKTDSDWPDIMRLNPLLEWSYHDIWHYIHMHKVPYCQLYAQGYTSIGYRSNTLPNPHLQHNSCSAANPAAAVACFKPAWELADPTTERAGRLNRK